MNTLCHSPTPAKLFSRLFHASVALCSNGFDWAPVERLGLRTARLLADRAAGVLCGNGGSRGNANHLANDFLYALSKTPGSGLRVHALSANPSVITCLANDEGYDQVFSLQLAVLARKGDVLIVFSGIGQFAEYRPGARGGQDASA